MGISITGVQAVVRSQRQAKGATGKNIAQGLQECAECLLRASQKLVPVQHPRVNIPNLKETGHVESKGVGLNAESRVVYDTKYAIYVHEDMDVYHEPPTQARFLTDAVPKVRGAMTNILKRKVLVGVRDGKDTQVLTMPEKNLQRRPGP